MIITKTHLFFLDGENCGKWIRISAADIWKKYKKLLDCKIVWTDNFALRGTATYKMQCDKSAACIGHISYSFEDWQKKIEVEAKDCISVEFGDVLKYKVKSFFRNIYEHNRENGEFDSSDREFDREKELEITLYPEIGYNRMLVARYEQEQYKLINYPIRDGMFFGTDKVVKISTRDFEVAKYL